MPDSDYGGVGRRRRQFRHFHELHGPPCISTRHGDRCHSAVARQLLCSGNTMVPGEDANAGCPLFVGSVHGLWLSAGDSNVFTILLGA